MAPQSRGKPDKGARAFKVIKNSKRTQTTKQYRFQSFSDRIAKLNIDPVRRTEARREDFDSNDAISSHFKIALEDWRDKNLTDHFSNFIRDVEPLSESLPQLLHHADRISELLLQYIENGTALSLEPLLDLLAQFAHDLGARFEIYFEASVRSLTTVARTQQDIEVIERSLNSLVWLFKYLSRLLVPDLRPTYNLLAPLLGKEKQKPFIARFAAEALSFLLRKAAAKYERDQEPLRVFLRHVLADVGEAVDNELYQRAVMTLFFEGIKGVQNGLHSAGLPVVVELLHAVTSSQSDKPVSDVSIAVLQGTLTALIHHCTANTFQPVLTKILEATRLQAPDPQAVRRSIEFLYLAVAVRKGTRITSWNTIYERLQSILEALTATPPDEEQDGIFQSVLATVAVIFHLSPLQDALSHLRLFDILVGCKTLTKHFYGFCDFFAAINPERFRAMVLPVLRKFVKAQAPDECHPLLVLYPRLLEAGIVDEQGSTALLLGSAWERKMLKDFTQLLKESEGQPELRHELLHVCNGELDLPLGANVHTQLNKMLDAQPIELSTRNQLLHDFIWGKALKANVTSWKDKESLWRKARSRTPDAMGLVPFWQGIESLLQKLTVEKDTKAFAKGAMEVDDFMSYVYTTLSLPSHELRLTALRIIEHLYTMTGRHVPQLFSTALSIEQSSFDAQSARSLSMDIRRLATSYEEFSSDEWVAKAIPTYLFGLTHVHLSSVWNDAAEAINVICQSSAAHDVVMDLASKWLVGSEIEFDQFSFQSELDDDSTSSEKRFYNDFECSNVAQLDQISRKSWTRMSNVQLKLEKSFDKTHRRVPGVSKHCREQALRILNAIPAVAEKRSRLIVPLFLEWANHAELAEESDSSDATLTESSRQRWNRKDQKAIITLFASMGNPKVLYRSEEVHEALIGLLTNGDTELQKPALKALLAWKSHVLGRYKEDLFNLLDDDRFRDTLAKIQIVGEDIEDPAIRHEDRDELMPFLLRILYGRTIAKGGASAKGGGLEARKKAVFAGVKRFGDKALQQFLNIALGPLQTPDPFSDEDVLSPRKQQGLLNTLKSMIAVLRQGANPLIDQLVPAVFHCIFRSHSGLGHNNAGELTESDSLLKDTRQISLQCLTLLFELFPDHDWKPYLQPLFDRVISPRLPNLPIETAHSISGLLKLFSSWSKNSATASYLFDDQDMVVHQLTACLQVDSAKSEVKLFIIGSIFIPLVQLAGQDAAVAGGIRSHSSRLLEATEHVMRGSPTKELLDTSVGFFGNLSNFVPVAKCFGLIEISIFLLKQPSGRVSPKVKNRILRALLGLLNNLRTPGQQSTASPMEQIAQAFQAAFDSGSASKSGEEKAKQLAEDVYNTLSSLFAFFEDRESRSLLCEVFEALNRPCNITSHVSAICTDINAFDDSRLDEPAWDVRGEAWTKATSIDLQYGLTEWIPLVWNALFFIRDQEAVLRSNASIFLKHFIDAVSLAEEGEMGAFLTFAEESLLQGIQRGVRNPVEDIRLSFLLVLAHAVRELPTWSVVADMQGLLVGTNEEEASFFNNILHIQQHRRLRALRRLAKETSTGVLNSSTIARILLPLLDHFIFDAKQADQDLEPAASSVGSLGAEAVTTIGVLVQWLEWSQYRALLKRHGGYIKERPDQERVVMRLIGVLVDALSQANTQKRLALAGDSNEQCRLAQSMPQPAKLADELSKQMLPQLSQYLHDKDEATVSRRAPVAITIIKLLRLLPDADFASGLPPILMDLCHILRSRAQESRDLTRRTLSEIANLIGPTYFGFILKELRRALQRGYQLHVLSFTVHSILVQVAGTFKPGDLDYCINEVVEIIMDDIFGVTGQEKDAEEYISKMKEVKSSKSYDSMELVASLTTLPYLADLVRPIRHLLREKLDDRMVKKVDELLRRLRRGLVRNDSIAQQGILVFCHEIWNEIYKTTASDSSVPRKDYKTKRYIMNMKAAHKAANRGSISEQSGKLVCFVIDLLRDIIPKNEELQTPAKLNGFMDMIGDAAVSGDEDTRVAVFKLIASLLRVVKTPFPRLDKDAAIYAREAMRVVRDAHSTRTEAAQAALRMVSEILQKRKDTMIRDNDAALLLKALKNDLDEPERQTSAFGFLRAVIARRIVIPEVYDVVDDVAAIMVTNHSRETRKLARDAYFAFMMDYPQAKGRLDKQIAYLVKNLSYQHLEGRQSVMEVLHLILTKVGNDLVGTIQDLVFLPLVMTLVNDDEAECRAFAGILVKDLFERADATRNKNWLKLMQGWVAQSQNAVLRQAGFQLWELYLEVVPNGANKTKDFVAALEVILTDSDENPNTTSADLVYFALKSFAAWARMSKHSAFAADLAHLWDQIREAQFFPGAWVRLVTLQLVGACLGYFAKCSLDLSKVPLTSQQGLELGHSGLLQNARACLMAFQIADASTELIDQAVRNLSFLLRCFASNELSWTTSSRSTAGGYDHASDKLAGETYEWDGFSESEHDSFNETIDSSTTESAYEHVIMEMNSILRREATTKGPNTASIVYAKTSVLKLLVTLLEGNGLPPQHLATMAPNILRSLKNVIDSSSIYATSMNSDLSSAHTTLSESAHELVGKLQTVLGNEQYHEVLMKVQKEAKTRRDERRAKRKLDTINEPERMDLVKRKKRDAAKVRRKVKNQEMRGRRRGW